MELEDDEEQSYGVATPPPPEGDFGNSSFEESRLSLSTRPDAAVSALDARRVLLPKEIEDQEELARVDLRDVKARKFEEIELPPERAYEHVTTHEQASSLCTTCHHPAHGSIECVACPSFWACPAHWLEKHPTASSAKEWEVEKRKYKARMIQFNKDEAAAVAQRKTAIQNARAAVKTRKADNIAKHRAPPTGFSLTSLLDPATNGTQFLSRILLNSQLTCELVSKPFQLQAVMNKLREEEKAAAAGTAGIPSKKQKLLNEEAARLCAEHMFGPTGGRPEQPQQPPASFPPKTFSDLQAQVERQAPVNKIIKELISVMDEQKVSLAEAIEMLTASWNKKHKK